VADGTVQLMRQDIRSGRKKIVAANLPLTEAEAVKFWPVYDLYVVEHSKIQIYDIRHALLKEYAQNCTTMTNELANSFVKRWTATEEQMARLRLNWMPEFEKVISPKRPPCTTKLTGVSASWSNCNCHLRFLWSSRRPIPSHELNSRLTPLLD